MSFCIGRKIGPFQPPIGLLLEYLLQEFKKEKGRSYSSMNLLRSAISAIATIDNVPAGRHPLVCRFMKAVFQLRPSLSRSRITWDPDLVLTYIAGLGPNDTLSTIQLARKLVMLMLLVSGQRGQALHVLDIRNMSVSPSRVSFRIGDLLKTSRPGDHFSEMSFDAYVPNQMLCVYTTILCYLRRTSDVRGNLTGLFLTTRPPFKVASRDTLRRWTKDVMCSAGLDLNMFSPHSTRSSASSKAALSLPLSTIVATIGWANDSTFGKYYQKPIGDSTLFAEAILHRQ